jgi:hypothetical protein
MLAARCPAAFAIETPTGVQVISFEITIDTLAAGTCGSATWGGLDDHQRRLIFLRNLSWR